MEKRRRIINSNLNKTLSSLGCNILKNELLSKHCSFKIGGYADFFIEIPNKKALSIFLSNVSKDNYLLLGSGTNVLFSDDGYKGIVVSLIDKFKKISVLGEEIVSGSGALLSDVLNIALKNNLLGFEFTAGIPGTVGGAIYGNAGSKNNWVSKAIKSVEIYKNSKKEILSIYEIDFSYRRSGLENCIITNVNFNLKKNTKNDNLNNIFLKNIRRRIKTQPLNMYNAGCIFKNPDGFSAGKLIEESNLKGINVGAAQISNIHGNFIINNGGASSKDVLTLIDIIREKVKEKFNIILETEIKIVK
ncbi:MAG: UDP-N-acetylmuramate dehydrogenase [Endomicrobium sp.]|jgi:UDP-N-acetylmuramate dehydrogenase|nr:UDP-N-acetylmuramate dehydrogenase [Endomicrobium sp.]